MICSYALGVLVKVFCMIMMKDICDPEVASCFFGVWLIDALRGDNSWNFEEIMVLM